MPTTTTSGTRTPTFEDHFTGQGDVRLFEQGWLPEGQAHSTVALVHGYGDHSGRYAHVAGHLTAHGHAVYAYDQRGHGRSEGPRAYVDSFDEYVGDLGRFVDRVAARTGGTPLFLMGHSMGGAAATFFCIEQGPALDGLILSSPFLHAGDTAPRWLQRLAGLIGRLFPRLPTIRLDRAQTSHDPAEVARARQDPLNFHGRIPARTGYELLRAVEYIQAHAAQITLPLLVFHGTADRLADPRGSYRLYARARSDDKTLGVYEGFYHETFNEPERAQVLDELTTWLSEHV